MFAATSKRALNNLKDAIKSDDGDRIKKTMEALQQSSLKLGEEVYKATAKGGGDGPQTGPGSQHRPRYHRRRPKEGRRRHRRRV